MIEAQCTCHLDSFECSLAEELLIIYCLVSALVVTAYLAKMAYNYIRG